MIVGGRDFEDIYDLVGVRVLVETVRDCYAALGALHARWNPVPGRFKDYIAMPKFNMYQSLHTTVIGPGGKPVEIQIRTHEMHRRAEYGVAAHWKYKEDPQPRPAPRAVCSRATARPARSTTWRGCASSSTGSRRPPTPASSSSRCASRSTPARSSSSPPRARSSHCPAGSTPVDFAYAVHTEVGHHCIGARVNGRLVPAREPARQRRRRRDVHLQGRRRGPVAGLALTSSGPPGPATRSGSGSPRNAARR